MGNRFVSVLVLGCCVAGWSGTACAASLVTGSMTSAGVTGRNVRPHGWFEELIYISPKGSGVGDADWTGSPDNRGFFDLAIPGGLFAEGPYAIFALKLDGAPAFDYELDVMVPGGSGTFTHSFRMRADYSVMYDQSYTEWSDGPWVWGNNFYQTFVATSRHVTRTATRLIQKNAGVLNLSLAVYETNEGLTSTWKRVTPISTRYIKDQEPIGNFIIWAAYHSKYSTLVPGKRYALRAWCPDLIGDNSFGILARPDQGDGYAEGQMYVNDAPQPGWDMYGYVSGGGDNNTIVNMAPTMVFGNGTLLGWSGRFGQTFQATGEGLAALEMPVAPVEFYTRAVTFQLYDGVGGNAIGPAKTCHGAPGPFQSRVGVFWYPGEAPLVPGRTYYVEGTSDGVNVWSSAESYPNGNAYIDRVSQGAVDLQMIIAEYEVLQQRDPALLSVE